MKKKLITIIISSIAAFSASAVELKKDSFYCINSKSIMEYYKYKNQGFDDFAQDLVDRSKCFTKGKDEKVFLKTEQKTYVELELLSGFTVWTKKENIIR